MDAISRVTSGQRNRNPRSSSVGMARAVVSAQVSTLAERGFLDSMAISPMRSPPIRMASSGSQSALLPRTFTQPWSSR
jgi:hypothetical protein